MKTNQNYNPISITAWIVVLSILTVLFVTGYLIGINENIVEIAIETPECVIYKNLVNKRFEPEQDNDFVGSVNQETGLPVPF